MLSREQILKAYQDFLDELAKDIIWHKDLLHYDQFEISAAEGEGPLWLVFHMQASGFVREILNSLNQFRNYIARLAAWCPVLSPCSDEEKLDLLVEFVYPIALCSIDYPYKVRNRFIYSACCLCDSANQLLANPPAAHLPKDKDINFKTLNTIGKGWSNVGGLINALASVNSDTFRKQTGDFRHVEHHRIPQAIEMGYSLLLSRLPSIPGTRRYGIGGTAPLTLDALVGFLVDEHRHGVNAFSALWVLIEEQRGLFRRNLTTG